VELGEELVSSAMLSLLLLPPLLLLPLLLLTLQAWAAAKSSVVNP
jgi:hypothetical protein